MKLRVTIATIMICALLSIASCAKTTKKSQNVMFQTDSIICATLGNSITETLFKPSKVTCYSVKGKNAVADDDFEITPHCVRDSMICKLRTDEIAILQFILLSDPKNYEVDSVLVRSPYVPEMEFCFNKNKMQVHVLISFSDFSWTIIADGKKQGNWNYTDREMISRFRNLMLKK